MGEMTLCFTKLIRCKTERIYNVFFFLMTVMFFAQSYVYWQAAAAGVVVDPPMPLLNVPFQVTASDFVTGQVLFLSRLSKCELNDRIGDTCILSEDRKCTFNVSSASVNVNAQYAVDVPKVYICSTAFPYRIIDSLQLHVIATLSRFVFKGTPQYVIFNKATPAGSVVGFFIDDSCAIQIPDMPAVTLGESRKAGITRYDAGVIFLCARIPLKNDGGVDKLTSFLPASTLLVVSRFNLLDTKALRYTKKVFSFTNFDRLGFASFSRSKNCDSLLQEPVKGQVMHRVELPILVPKGEYYFCIGLEYYMDYRLYVPSENRVTVREYGVQPHTMYAGLSTIMSLSLDAEASGSKETMSVALFSLPGCKDGVVIDWQGVGAWVVRKPGLYYACVRGSNPKNTEPALAANISVLNAPLASVPSSVFSGLDFTVSLSNVVPSKPAKIAVGLSLTPDCVGLIYPQIFLKSDNTAVLRVPWGVFNTVSFCLSTPVSTKVPSSAEELDRGYMYSVDTINVKVYSITYAPMFAGIEASIALDPNLMFGAKTLGVFSTDAVNCLKTIGTSFSMGAISVIKNVLFPDAGIYFLCVKPPESASYVSIAEVTVYGSPSLSPRSVVSDTPTDVFVSLLPPAAPVSIVDSASCDLGILVNGVADAKGQVKFQQFSHAEEKSLTLCVGYKGSHSQNWILSSVASLPVTGVKVFSEVLVATQVNRVEFLVPDKNSLIGFEAVVVRGAANLCTGVVGPSLPVTVPDKGRAFIYVQFSDAAKWTVCMGKSKTKMRAVGELTSMAPLEITMEPSTGAVGLPVKVKISGPFLSAFRPSQFFVTDKAESCAFKGLESVAIYGKGSINAVTGVTETFVLEKEGSLFICVGKKGYNDEDTPFFVFGGTIKMERFKSISHYAIRDTVNDLKVFPHVTGASLFLIACLTGDVCTYPVSRTACAGARERYYTSLLVPLRNAAVGRYILCQEYKNKRVVEASETFVSVLNPFVATILDAAFTQYKPVKMRLSGGDVKTRREDITVFTMPQGISCSETSAQREDFVFAGGVVEQEITVTRILPFANKLQLCLKASASDIFSVATFEVLPYMTPAVIITDRDMHIRSGTTRDGIFVKLTAKKDCQGNVMSHRPVRMKNFISKLHVKSCADDNHLLTTVHYCESYDGGSNYEHRGVMSLVRLRECSPDFPAAIRQITVPPAKQIEDYGINTSLLMQPMLSLTSDCKNMVNYQKGYWPKYDEVAVFYVCVSVKVSPNYVFTTDTQTLRVANFKTTPTTIIGRVSASVGVPMPFELTLNYPTGTEQTYLSHSPKCSKSLVSMAGFASVPPRTSLLLTGEDGVKYLCARTVGDGEVKAVAPILVVYPPIALKVDPVLVRTAPFRATLLVLSEVGSNPLYSLVPNEDAKFSFAHLYAYSFRGVFLSNDVCRTVLTGTDVVNVPDSGRVVLSTKLISNDLKFLSLCAGTPAGNVSVLSGIEVSTSIIFPSKFVLGADMEVYIPLSPNSVFYVREDSNCGGYDIVPSFITNNEARGTLSFKRYVGTGLLPAGRWTLCKQMGASSPGGNLLNSRLTQGLSQFLRPLVSIEAFAPVYYNIRGRDVVVGVSSVVILLDDLKPESLLPGLSTDKSCKEPDESYGAWHVLNNQNAGESRRIVIRASEPISAIYLCAVAPVNGSVVSVPFDSGLRFVLPSTFLPPTLLRCGSTKLASCVLPGSSPLGAFVTVIKGDCCDVAQRGNVVGQMRRTSENQCSLEMDPSKINAYSQNTEFSVCAWDANDYSYCVTLGTVKVGSDGCTQKNSVSTLLLGNGVLVAVLIFAVIFGVLLIVLLTCLVVECYKKRTIMKEMSIATTSLRSGSEINPLTLYNHKKGNVFLGRGDQLLYGPNGVQFVGGSQPTITVTGSTEQTVGQSTSREVSPELLRLTLWEGIESDERDQVALLEARARYKLRLAFGEGLERIRLAEKEQAVQFELSDEEVSHQIEVKNPDYTAIKVASIPTVSVASLLECSPVGKGRVNESASISSSHDVMNYTTTQRFFDEWRFTLDSETVRRQRILNWEDEEWHVIVDKEFTAYLFLQQGILSLPPRPASPSPLPDAIVRPFTFFSDQQLDEIVEYERRDNEINSVPGSVAQLMGDSVACDSGGIRRESARIVVDGVSLQPPPTPSDVPSALELLEDVGELSSIETGTSLGGVGRLRKGPGGSRNGRSSCSDVSKRSARHYADPLKRLEMEGGEERFDGQP